MQRTTRIVKAVAHQKVPRHRPNLISSNIDGEVVILDHATGTVHHLNATASHIWKACDGSRSANDIAACVATDFDGVPAKLLEEVLAALSDLDGLGLLVDGNTSTQPTTEAQNEKH